MMRQNIKPNILWLRENFGWMGSHSGYDQLFEAIAELQTVNHSSICKEYKNIPSVGKRIISGLTKQAKVSPYYNSESTIAEFALLWKAFTQKTDLIHTAYVEHSLGILLDWKQRLSLKIVGTAHQPTSWWRLMHRYEDRIALLNALIVPGSREVSYFENYLPGRVFFVPHGVDIDFFKPKSETVDSDKAEKYPRCVFSGTWLRDIDTLAVVVDQLIAKNPNIRFDMIVPISKRDHPAFYRIARHEQVTWHAGISDEQLRTIYQQASLLLLPIIDSTANNALLEGMSCGLPVVSNNVGGLLDYTRNDFADLLPVGDIDGMVESVIKLIDDPQQQNTRGAAARFFVEENLTWDKIAMQTLEVYSKVIG
ncbi:MAG: glycosyltransferase family 4 protein [Cyanomargarita calcarea GSE-NOS-MK-12-04C]|uniref:Glycosyltransferase family 4 protein n=1 Tax=Cyanomargarita calcarea GSE-NOS-MK-12-04C TaxID=2839659 RepID=A0A951QML9_9CYAN|nr:glycosyltransferase family 4 protein [Cyanomargarita calcarea GSE-NOS-MK-12-04C]